MFSEDGCRGSTPAIGNRLPHPQGFLLLPYQSTQIRLQFFSQHWDIWLFQDAQVITWNLKNI